MEKGIRFETPEKEREYLEREVQEKRRQEPEREIRDIIEETLRKHTEYRDVSEPVPPPEEKQKHDLDRDVGYLVRTAFEEGILEAAERARGTHNPYLFKEFYIALVERFLDDLKQRGVIETHE
ncbi:MAG: hypothetical protein A3F26_01405 [Candidatus Ryanbacteria bacterium RIFCSPHIGHO2_12_FULL_47_12b]|uniref:Uncharacterized protein n=2 Tax=Candidatus Ryaniibacteriota TaxID=1817914 RepID=A0A1G2H513_9BACT|nr:MAG: hypothetical protein UX74_C0042G0002 [Parcubacteria group bacterium GW2011_GWA2_47_10b]OGZ48414.1 MAG: hypothetical protein A3C83_02215 [Candidatus Ryanbacteria bacterium RIFCSPHIGHO2_02_FULL_47_25]OGZ52566.1 MAG: hypothetical protein A3F26_01405 [Candidatus Ryanbacteria bacterium RIFCSPHIGHO2_12_FULL_47_12b]OGZ56624.1 MAG: hypothetical protein A3J04_01735 [Candidatus Ryanbacteria bacterium RIFCSPLOWO2_02_FULL_47_14]OGZ57565.1 MAG: hypothetical protein A3G60_01040 [Candidatus Ryanbacter